MMLMIKQQQIAAICLINSFYVVVYIRSLAGQTEGGSERERETERQRERERYAVDLTDKEKLWTAWLYSGVNLV